MNSKMPNDANFKLKKIVYKCVANKNIIVLHCKFTCYKSNSNGIAGRVQVDIGIKQYLQHSKLKHNDSSDDKKSWIVVFTKLKGSTHYFEHVLSDILSYQLQSKYESWLNQHKCVGRCGCGRLIIEE